MGLPDICDLYLDHLDRADAAHQQHLAHLRHPLDQSCAWSNHRLEDCGAYLLGAFDLHLDHPHLALATVRHWLAHRLPVPYPDAQLVVLVWRTPQRTPQRATLRYLCQRPNRPDPIW